MAEVYHESCRQPYNDMHIAAGWLEGHEVDTVYFEIVREDGRDHVKVVMRPDEMAALIWVCSGALWSRLIEEQETLDVIGDCHPLGEPQHCLNAKTERPV